MAGPWEGFTQGFTNIFGQILDQKQRQKMMQMENQNRISQIQLASQLQDQELTPEMKLLKVYQQNPEILSNYRKALDPGFETDQMYKKGMLGVQQQNIGLEQQKLNILGQKDSSTDLMRNIQYLQKILPGKKPEELLDILIKSKTPKKFDPWATPSPNPDESFTK